MISMTDNRKLAPIVEPVMSGESIKGGGVNKLVCCGLDRRAA